MCKKPSESVLMKSYWFIERLYEIIIIMKMKKRSHRYDMNKLRPRRGNKYTKAKYTKHKWVRV